MSSQKPSIPKGTRDFIPTEMVRRNFIFDNIRKVFQSSGYVPIETPAMENLSTLMGKYGEEGDKLLFKILNSGNYLSGIRDAGYGMRDGGWEMPELNTYTRHIAEKGLRYDLTVPFARFVVQHQHELVFPFKRYQIQPVWRADRPQKGRYREFFQCDVDVIGSNSLLNEVELIQIIDSVFIRLDIKVVVKLNNRKILAGIAEAIGAPEKLTDITVAIDKLDKIGLEKVSEELETKGLSGDSVRLLVPIMTMEGRIQEKREMLDNLFVNSETGKKGLEEISEVMLHLKNLELQNKFEFDLSLARGLNYYTGTIIEVKAAEVTMGSLCGGGRYDNLTGIFGLPDMSGVGISFGADRIYDVMEELRLFPESIESTTKLLILNFGKDEEKYGLQLLAALRKSEISSEIYPEASKLKKQMEYANRKNIPFVVFAGQNEISAGKLTLKDMRSGEQKPVTPDELKNILSK